MAVGEIISGVNLLLGFLKKSNTDTKEVKEWVKQNRGKIGVVTAQGSMIKFLKKYIVEPTAIVSTDLKHEEILEKVIELEADIFSGFYMQVFDILNKVNGLSGALAIELMSTDTSLGNAIASTAMNKLSKEDQQDYIKNLLKDELGSLSLEAKSNKRESGTMDVVDNDITKNVPTIIQRTLKLKMRIDNGSSDTYTVEIPILVKVNIVYVKRSSILAVLENKSEAKTFANRLDDFRSGAITLSELVFAGDLIKQYKNNKIKDDDDLIALLSDKNMSSATKIATTESGLGFERYYNFLIITEEDKIAIENALHGKLTKAKYKEQLLEKMLCLMVSVIDRDYERVMIQTKDLDGKSDISYKALNKRKSNQQDYSEIFKALVSGRNPAL